MNPLNFMPQESVPKSRALFYTLEIHCAFAYTFCGAVVLQMYMCACASDSVVLEVKPSYAGFTFIFPVSLPLS